MKEQKEVRRCSCRVQQGKREGEDDVSCPISYFKSFAFLMDMDGPVSNLDVMGQDSHLGCKSLKARGLFHVGPGESETKVKCFKGLGLHSRPYVEEKHRAKT